MPKPPTRIRAKCSGRGSQRQSLLRRRGCDWSQGGSWHLTLHDGVEKGKTGLRNERYEGRRRWTMEAIDRDEGHQMLGSSESRSDTSVREMVWEASRTHNNEWDKRSESESLRKGGWDWEGGVVY